MNMTTVQTHSREGKPQTTREYRSGGHHIHTWPSSTETELLTWHFVKFAGKLMMRKKRQVHPWLSCMKCGGGCAEEMGGLELGREWDNYWK